MFWCHVLNSLNTSTNRMLPNIYCYPCGHTLSAPFVATFPLAVSLLLFCPVVYMDPTLSSFSKALNCFRFIDLFAPYSSNNLSTKDCATGPFKLRASSCEKTWESVVLMRAKKHRRSKTVQAFAESIYELYNKKAPFCSASLPLYAGKHVKFCWVLMTNRDFSHGVTGPSRSAEHLFQAPKIFPRLKEALPYSMKVFVSLQIGICLRTTLWGISLQRKNTGSKRNQNVQFRPLKQDEEYPQLLTHFMKKKSSIPLLSNRNPPPSPPKSEGIRAHVRRVLTQVWVMVSHQ